MRHCKNWRKAVISLKVDERSFKFKKHALVKCKENMWFLPDNKKEFVTLLSVMNKRFGYNIPNCPSYR